MTTKLNVTYNIVVVTIAAIVWKFVVHGISISNGTKLYLGYPNDTVLNFTELTSKYGYYSEEHKVVTEDGYILTVFRIVKAKNCDAEHRKPPVILEHGLLQSSDAWIDAGPNAGLAYLLADACYDVWVGNQRGNYYSRKHKHLNPSNPEFWNFSVDEIGYYDIPATLDYVLDYTDQKKVNYIGYSQGTSTFLIMCSEKPGFCDKVNLMIALAPAARQTYTKSVPYRAFCEGLMYFETPLRAAGFLEVFPKAAIAQEFLGFMCQFKMLSTYVCGTAKTLIDSYHPGSISDETFRVMFSHFPAGTSLKNLIRYAQSMNSLKFQKYDYGMNNLKVYGNKFPPMFNLTAVTVPVVVIYGRNDYLVDTKDVFWLVKKLPNVIDVIEVSDPLWNHFDSTYSQYTEKMILPKINQYLSQYTSIE